MLVQHEPQVQKRVEQPYVAIRRQVTDGVPAAVDSAFPELFGWLGEHGVKPSGPPFIRFLEVDAQGEPLELEVAVPVVGGVEGDERVLAEVLPAGRYVTFLHAGPYRSTTEPDLAAARAMVQDWAVQQGIPWDRWDTDRGSAFRCYVEHYHVGPVEETDYSKWETELAYLVSES
ncbi:MAG TPA: GyrI-like domain-containing protein [Solirubrobacteraceae bacterium]|nr:GyrI-like domain-containing protein [Solirubrobacteraceae bacterium]